VVFISEYGIKVPTIFKSHLSNLQDKTQVIMQERAPNKSRNGVHLGLSNVGEGARTRDGHLALTCHPPPPLHPSLRR
jgi:hypothetical protein